MTTTDADDRYQRFKGNKATNNLRVSICARCFSAGKNTLSIDRPIVPVSIPAFWKASNAKEIDSDFDSFLNALKGGVDA